MRSDSGTTSIKTRPGRPEAGAVLPLASALRLVVMRLARRLRQQADAGITPSMLSALSSIERHGPMTLSELAAHERVQPPTITTVLGRLEASGLVTRDPDLEDRRVSWVSLTAEGRRFLEANRSKKTAYLAKRLAALDPQDRATLEKAARILERLVEQDRS
jgi:DNA-binding MarR family transcriptional regulator